MEDDKFLTIQLLSFDCPGSELERYYFMEMSTLQATTLISPERIIMTVKISGNIDGKGYFDESNLPLFQTIKDFNAYFKANPNYFMINCDIKLDGGLNVHSHDDGEVSIEFPKKSKDLQLILHLFEKYHLNKELLVTLQCKPGHYLAIDKDGNFLADFNDFEDYLKRRP